MFKIFLAIALLLGAAEPSLTVDKGTFFTINLGNEAQLNTWVYDIPRGSCLPSGKCFKSKVSFITKGIQEHAEYFDFKALERGSEYLHFSLVDSEHKVVSDSTFLVVIK